MHMLAIEQNGAEQTQTFECQNCDARLDMPSAGYIGLQFWVWLIVGPILIWFFLIDAVYVSTVTYVFVLGFVAVGAYWCLQNVVTHFQHPFIHDQDSLEQSRPTSTHAPSFIAKILNLGFIITPLVVLGVAGAILGLVAVAGYINDYVL